MNVSARHLESRFTNFINNEKVGGYTIVNAYIDIGDGFAAGPFSQVKARVNVDNLLRQGLSGHDQHHGEHRRQLPPGLARTIQFTISADF
jgi:iron complex outermembrane receptor protein